MPYYGASVEYALHTMVNLSEVPLGVSASARDLAEFQHLPVPFIRKLLTQLSGANLITGAEGIRGGWQLSRPPSQITLLEVAEAVQPEQSLFKCQEIRRHCALWQDGQAPKSSTTGVCAIHAAMLAAEKAMKQELSSRTIADISLEVAAKSEGSGEEMNDWFSGRYNVRRNAKSVANKGKTER